MVMRNSGALVCRIEFLNQTIEFGADFLRPGEMKIRERSFRHNGLPAVEFHELFRVLPQMLPQLGLAMRQFITEHSAGILATGNFPLPPQEPFRHLTEFDILGCQDICHGDDEDELCEHIDGMSLEQQAELLVLVWIGRDDGGVQPESFTSQVNDVIEGGGFSADHGDSIGRYLSEKSGVALYEYISRGLALLWEVAE